MTTTDADVCRWALDCDTPATVTIDHGTVGPVRACDDHATEHTDWQQSTALNRGAEPEPECWCPDGHRDNGLAVEYCPAHGTPEARGIEPPY